MCHFQNAPGLCSCHFLFNQMDPNGQVPCFIQICRSIQGGVFRMPKNAKKYQCGVTGDRFFFPAASRFGGFIPGWNRITRLSRSSAFMPEASVPGAERWRAKRPSGVRMFSGKIWWEADLFRKQLSLKQMTFLTHGQGFFYAKQKGSFLPLRKLKVRSP